MTNPVPPIDDDTFHDAVSAIDRGDLDELRRLLAAHPDLAAGRLEGPGQWLRETSRTEHLTDVPAILRFTST